MTIHLCSILYYFPESGEENDGDEVEDREDDSDEADDPDNVYPEEDTSETERFGQLSGRFGRELTKVSL
ncbi:unnamed protein product [Protopolystoma xenopodis]|uniref:Uncharacterized protein n=1 Tax=Protopolystoma xenopodis TaxID=117903 RepID=A0A448X4S0_9PLAT|nr:unnamed protein product [Protopolystoma xenopodis]